jgi:uncharacterized coiled-coil protein SlyX
MKQRIAELETQLAFQEDMLQTLNDIVTRKKSRGYCCNCSNSVMRCARRRVKRRRPRITSRIVHA